MIKKNLPLILIVLLLGAVLGYLKYSKTKSNYEDIEFGVSNTDDIGSISISDKYGNETVLKRKDGNWWVNDSIQAERSKMLILLSTIQKLQVEIPVGDSLRQKAIDDLRQIGKKVIIKDRSGNDLRTFFVGSNVGNGNYMILSTDGAVSANPYVVKIPGISSLNLRHRFVALAESWYSTEVFGTTIDKIKTVKVRYHKKPNFSFILEKDEELIKIDPLTDSVKIKEPLNREKVVQFLLEFEMKHFEGRLKNDAAVQFIQKSKPHYSIELTDVFDKTRSIDLYRIPIDFDTQDIQLANLDAKGEQIPFNVEKYWGYIPHTGEYVIVQHYAFGPIIMPYSSFFED